MSRYWQRIGRYVRIRRFRKRTVRTNRNLRNSSLADPESIQLGSMIDKDIGRALCQQRNFCSNCRIVDARSNILGEVSQPRFSPYKRSTTSPMMAYRVLEPSVSKDSWTSVHTLWQYRTECCFLHLDSRPSLGSGGLALRLRTEGPILHISRE
jgi:hypothetical protein